MKILRRSFYQRHPAVVARELLGKVLARHLDGQVLSGRIVEVEAYSSDEPASHAYRGPTASNRALFGEPGRAYVYFTYGMHFCLNVVAHETGLAGGVLIRALAPLTGLERMTALRGRERPRGLTRGPGNVARALAIDKGLYGADLTRPGPLYIADDGAPPFAAARAPRVGIRAATDRLWRFFIKDNPYVSGPRRSRP